MKETRGCGGQLALHDNRPSYRPAQPASHRQRPPNVSRPVTSRLPPNDAWRAPTRISTPVPDSAVAIAGIHDAPANPAAACKNRLRAKVTISSPRMIFCGFLQCLCFGYVPSGARPSSSPSVKRTSTVTGYLEEPALLTAPSHRASLTKCGMGARASPLTD
jgi:hypothetical protein